MARGPRYKVEYRRKREGKTNYKDRLNLLKSKETRLVVRKSNRYVLVQLVNYDADGDEVLVTTRSDELKNFNWDLSMKNTPAAYLTGLLCGYKGMAKRIKSAIVDMGLNPSTKGSKLYAIVKGARDAGMEIPISEDIIPSEERITSKTISSYSNNEDVVRIFEETKREIEKKWKK